uniref:Uncharacterized protein n=1 Tax=Aegilops tauschii subsp. strangulata TaxID=200361 RepID=A0A453KDE5_AEGTS
MIFLPITCNFGTIIGELQAINREARRITPVIVQRRRLASVAPSSAPVSHRYLAVEKAIDGAIVRVVEARAGRDGGGGCDGGGGAVVGGGGEERRGRRRRASVPGVPGRQAAQPWLPGGARGQGSVSPSVSLQ